MDFTRQCLLCDSDAALNTLMKVNVEDTSYEVAICEECEDDASPKAIRKIVQSKISAADSAKVELLTKMESLVEEAAALGIDLDFLKPKEEKRSAAPAQPVKREEVEIDAREYKVSQPRAIEVPRSAQGENLEQYDPLPTHQPLKLKDGTVAKPPREKTLESQVYETESGRPILIEKKKVGESGETDIRITNFTDTDLQRRAKKLARMEHSWNPKLGGSHALSECSFCGGTGVTRIGKKDCPKCGGSGYRT